MLNRSHCFLPFLLAREIRTCRFVQTLKKKKDDRNWTMKCDGRLRRFFHLKQACSELLGFPPGHFSVMMSGFAAWTFVCVSPPRIEQKQKSTQASQKQANRVLSPTRFVFFCSALPAQFPSREPPPRMRQSCSITSRVRGVRATRYYNYGCKLIP